MPVKSLNSSVLKWPDACEVDRAVRAWASAKAQKHTNAVRIGYFGSYARGDWGVGSDLDLLVIVEGSEEPFERRSLTWDLDDLPVSAELLIYTVDEWEKLQVEGSKFALTIEKEAVWLYQRNIAGLEKLDNETSG